MHQEAKQSGFALVTVLIMQLMIGVIAYAALDTAILGQTQTHASSEAHLAYNGAEQRLVAGMRCIQTEHKAGKSVTEIVDSCTGNGLDMTAAGGSDMLLSASEELNSGARRMLTLVGTPPMSNNLFDANGAYTCFGNNCSYQPPSSAASPGADGTDRMLPGHGEASPLDQGCGNNGNSRPPINSEGQNKAGVVIPSGSIEGSGGSTGGGKKKNNDGGGGGKKSQFEGEPPIVDSGEQYHDLYGEDGDLFTETLAKAEADLNNRIDALIPGAQTLDGDNVTLADGETGIWVVKEGQTLTLDGHTAGGTVILDGGTLDMKGNKCFAGMVASRNGGTIDAGGTSAIVGAVLQAAGWLEDGGLTADKSGNASMFYSSSTLEWAREVSNTTNSGDRWSFGNYQQVTN